MVFLFLHFMHVTSKLYFKMKRLKFKGITGVSDVLNHPVLTFILALRIILLVFLPHDKRGAEC